MVKNGLPVRADPTAICEGTYAEFPASGERRVGKYLTQ